MAALHKAPTIKSSTAKTLKHLLGEEEQKELEDQEEEEEQD